MTTATVHTLPIVDLCPSCDSAMANRRGIYHCAWCGITREYGGTRDIVRDGVVIGSARIWYRLAKNAGADE